jgi:septal ring factor EnvC (AmiA/AmiB activator)
VRAGLVALALVAALPPQPPQAPTGAGYDAAPAAAGPASPAPATSPSPPAVPPAPATDEERLQKVRERRAALEQELKKMRGEEKSLLGEVEELELELQLRSEELREIQISLKRTRDELDRTTARVQQLEASLAAARPALARYARALYKLGDMSYLRLLLSIDRPSDFFRGYRLITTLARRDNARVARFREDLAALTLEKAELEKRTQESIALRNRLAAARHNLDAQRARKTELLTSLVERKELNAAYVAELSEAETRLAQMLAGLGEGKVEVPLGAFRGSLPWPVEGPVRVGFGRRKHPRFDTYTIHNGIEIAAPADAPVRAVHEGKVVFADRFRGYGLLVIVDHGDKHYSLYGQLAELQVSNGQDVSAGSVLGRADPAGADGPGVYFEMRYQGHPEDPETWLAKP